MKIVRLTVLAAALISMPSAAWTQGKLAAKDAVLYFIWPQSGATIKGGFWCRFGLRNMVSPTRGTNFRTAVIIICWLM